MTAKIRPLFPTTYHSNGEVTLWSPFLQGWVRGRRFSPETLASLSRRERLDVLVHTTEGGRSARAVARILARRAAEDVERSDLRSILAEGLGVDSGDVDGALVDLLDDLVEYYREKAAR